MGMHYYLCRGYAIDDWENCSLEKIFSDINSIEQIDMFTAQFNDFSEFRKYLIENKLIDVTEGIVIGNNKTKNGVKKLRPIYQRTFVFKNDLDMLGIKSRTYKEIAKELWKYVTKRQNNEEFMNFILESYTKKYENSKAPISADIFALNRIINRKEKTSRDKNEYEFSFANFFRNAIFKCKIIETSTTFDGRDSVPVKVFKPIDNEVNAKGLHDMLVHIIQYGEHYEYDHNASYDGVDKCLKENKTSFENKQYGEQIEFDIEYEGEEEFLEDRDFERPLSNYAKNRAQRDYKGNIIKYDPLDLNNLEEVEKDDYAVSFIMDQQRLVKKKDGME